MIWSINRFATQTTKWKMNVIKRFGQWLFLHVKPHTQKCSLFWIRSPIPRQFWNCMGIVKNRIIGFLGFSFLFPLPLPFPLVTIASSNINVCVRIPTNHAISITCVCVCVRAWTHWSYFSSENAQGKTSGRKISQKKEEMIKSRTRASYHTVMWKKNEIK